jgi:hypothetical protein
VTPLVPIALFGWIFVTIYFFSTKTPQQAISYSVIGGVLFLPMATYNFHLINEYDKNIAIAFGLILGELLSGKRNKFPLRMRSYDIPMLIWCFAAPLATSITNGLGLYDGISGVIQAYLQWGVFYWAGRRYFSDQSSIRVLSWGMIIGGILYIPLILFELRMSPQLSKIFYGFFPHSFAQHIRYGAYRPIVFMQHGLMVALWMAASTTVTYWLWRTKQIKKIWGVAAAFIVAILVALTILCKSANGWIFLLLGIFAFASYKRKKSSRLIRIVLLIVPLYLMLRISRIISFEQVQALASKFFDELRVVSLTYRLRQEDLFGARAMEQPLFGWGGYQRGWPIDPETGGYLLSVVDSFWVIVFSGKGLLGLTSIFLALGLGPWLALAPPRNRRGGKDNNPPSADVIALSLAIIFFLFDCLVNAMINPVYILCSGALVSNYCERRASRIDASYSTISAESLSQTD